MISRDQLATEIDSITGGLFADVDLTRITDYLHARIYPENHNMLVDWSKLSEGIKKDLREVLDNCTEDERREHVRQMGTRDVIDAFLRYNGIINYTGTILSVVDDVRAAAVIK